MNPALPEMFWTVAVAGPVYLALIAAGVWLWYRRRAAPRACVVAAGAVLTWLASQVGLEAVRQWLIAERDAANPVTQLSTSTLELARLSSLVLESLIVAAAILAVAWAVVLDRRSDGPRGGGPNPEEGLPSGQ